MSKNNPKKQTTTDSFLNFIAKQKDQEEVIEDRSKKDEVKTNQVNIMQTVTKGVNIINTMMDKVLSSNRSIRWFTLALTIVLVFVINGGSVNNILSTPTSGDLISDVDIEVSGLSQDHVLTGLPDSVDLMLVGSSLDIYRAKGSSDYRVYIDVATLSEGEHVVEFKTENFPNDLKIGVIPETATIRIDSKVTQSFPLTHEFINDENIDSKYSFEINEMEINTVDIRGGEQQIESIEKVVAQIDLSQMNEEKTQDALIVALDKDGNQVDVDITPETVAVSYLSSTYSKNVTIIPKLIGKLEAGLAVKSVSLNHNQVRIYGDESLLENIFEIEAEINVEDLKKDIFMDNISFVDIDGVYKFEKIQLNGDVLVEEAQKTTLKEEIITIEGNSHEYKVEYLKNNGKIDVQVEGAKSIVELLNNDDIQLSVNISDLQPGKHELPIILKKTSPYINVALETEVIEITILE